MCIRDSIELDGDSKWHGISDCWDDYEFGTNGSIDQLIEKTDINEKGNAERIIDFVLSNGKIDKEFDYKDTLPEYVSHDLYD